MEHDLIYLRRRASQERSAALQAGHPRARDAHQVMAERYEDLAGIALRQQQIHLPLVDAA